MFVRRLSRILIAALACACSGDHAAGASSKNPRAPKPAVAQRRRVVAPAAQSDSAPVSVAEPAESDDAVNSGPPPRATRPPRIRPMTMPDPVRGLYVSRQAATGPGIWQLLDLARHSEINALVIDVKDDNGLLLYPSMVGLVHAIGADTGHTLSVARVHALMDSLRAHRIFPIARIVIARDPQLAAGRPEWALPRGAGGGDWVDPGRPEVWAYAADLASEAAARGFSEVVFDDLQYPGDRTAPGPTAARNQRRGHDETLGDALRFLRSRLEIPIAVRVAGALASEAADPAWQVLAERADVVMPVVFPPTEAIRNAGLADPASQIYEITDAVLAAARRRDAGIPGAADLVPWYRDFGGGSPAADSAAVRAQIQAGYHNGIRSWMLWSSTGAYTASAVREPIRRDTTKARKPAPARRGHHSR